MFTKLCVPYVQLFLFLFLNFTLYAQVKHSNIESRFTLPDGYQRVKVDSTSFQHYLRHINLKPSGAKVFYYDGSQKINSNVAAAVLDVDVGSRDLQQCADAVMRLRAEFLYSQRRYTEIHFNLTNGFRMDYSKWAEGSRLKVVGNKTSWVPSAKQDYSYTTFRKYLDVIFMYAGTLSLSKELTAVSTDSIQAGDVFIYGGSPGHAVLVMDVAVNIATGKRLFIIAQSYMPAQSIHVLVNERNSTISPWYDLSKSDKLYTPEWTFEKSELKRWGDDLQNLCYMFNNLNIKIRDNLISKSEATSQLNNLIHQLDKIKILDDTSRLSEDGFVFPVAGYSLSAIGGTDGSGYVPATYDYFDGNKHTGHPAHDIFILDKNNDALDDRSLKPVAILAMTSGVVVSVETSWNIKSTLRGGNYIWIYQPFSRTLTYYAHNSNIIIKLGSIVAVGDTIAYMGRTGLNAYKQKSPTHLHLMQLKIGSDAMPKPHNYYSELLKGKTKQ